MPKDVRKVAEKNVGRKRRQGYHRQNDKSHGN